MAISRLKGLRTVLSTNISAGQSTLIGSIQYEPTTTVNMRMGEFDADSTLHSPKPIMIHAYDFTVASDGLCEMYQFYCDDGEESVAADWNPYNADFLQCLKQSELVCGTRQKYALNTGEVESQSVWQQRTIKFRSKSYWSKKHKERRWIVPPIVLSANKKNTVGWSIANPTSTTECSIYAKLRIKNWHQIT